MHAQAAAAATGPYMLGLVLVGEVRVVLCREASKLAPPVVEATQSAHLGRDLQVHVLPAPQQSVNPKQTARVNVAAPILSHLCAVSTSRRKLSMDSWDALGFSRSALRAMSEASHRRASPASAATRHVGPPRGEKRAPRTCRAGPWGAC